MRAVRGPIMRAVRGRKCGSYVRYCIPGHSLLHRRMGRGGSYYTGSIAINIYLTSFYMSI